MRVLIVDDHAWFRSVARMLLQASGYDVIGEAVDGASAMEAVSELRPDVVLLDIQLPDIDGCRVARLLAQTEAPPTVVLISSRDASDYGVRVQTCGARGFIAKVELSGAALDALLSGAE